MPVLRFLWNAPREARGLCVGGRHPGLLPLLHGCSRRAAALRAGARDQRSLLRAVAGHHARRGDAPGASPAGGHACVAGPTLRRSVLRGGRARRAVARLGRRDLSNGRNSGEGGAMLDHLEVKVKDLATDRQGETPEVFMNLEGGCSCAAVRYKLTANPLIVHACHCRDCQRITGSAFVINIWIEKQFVKANAATPKSFTLKGGSGKDHEVFFCDKCGTYVWSRYHGAPGDYLFVRAGTLDKPETVRPDVHIFTRSKLPWLDLPEEVPAFKSFYKIEEVWSAESRERLRRNRSGQT